jgi:methylmalonyl-CoA mutase N-terminal domain/subunit
MSPGEPGAWPYTRGRTRESYDERPWISQVWAGAGGPEETSRVVREILDAGADAAAIRCDRATRAGCDSDHSAYRDEAGVGGVALSHAGDLALLGGKLDGSRLFWLCDAAAAPLMACWWAAARASGQPAICFGVSNDPLGEAFADGRDGPEPWALRAAGDLSAWLAVECPQAIPFTLSGGGERTPADPAGELAAVLLHAAWSASRWGDAALRRATARLACGLGLLEQVAAFRAARTAFAHRFGEAAALSILAISWQNSLAAAQPDVNLVRMSLQAMGAALGGAQIISLGPHDAAQGGPAPLSARLAARILQILAAETGVTRTVDPAGGSDVIERRTRDLAERALALATALEGLPPAQAWDRLRAASGRPAEPVVGVTRHAAAPAAPPEPRGADAAHFARLAEWRASRSQQALRESLGRLRDAARGTGNVMPALVDAAIHRATLGELCACMRG